MESDQESLTQVGIYLTAVQHRRLKILAAEKGSNVSEIVRRFIDAGLDRETG